MATPAPVFALNVEGVGDFVFAKRNMRLQIAVEVEMARLSEGVDRETLGTSLQSFIEAVAVIKALAVETPPGWDPDNMDPFDEESVRDIQKVRSALDEKEASFRRGSQKPPPPNSEGAGTEPGILVPPSLPAAAE